MSRRGQRRGGKGKPNWRTPDKKGKRVGSQYVPCILCEKPLILSTHWSRAVRGLFLVCDATCETKLIAGSKALAFALDPFAEMVGVEDERILRYDLIVTGRYRVRNRRFERIPEDE